MAKLTSVFLGALLIALFNTELHFTDAGPVPELSVKLMCELLCEHCNGVPNMESGHCNCQVPEAHFKDNAACLERVQISAAEMNLKLTHRSFKNTLRKRSSTDISSGGPERSESQTDNTYEPSSEPSLPEHKNMDPDVNKSPELMPQNNEGQAREIFTIFDSILTNPTASDIEDQSSETQHLKKRSINGAPTSSDEPLYRKTVMNAMVPSSLISDSDVSSSKLPGLHTRRNKRSTAKETEVDINKDNKMSRRAISGSSNDGDVDFQFDADITIPIFPYGRITRDNSPNPRSQIEVDSQFPNKPTSEAKESKAFGLNKHQSNVQDGYKNDLLEIEKNNPVLSNPITFSPPTIKSQTIFGVPNENTLLQMSKLNDLKLKLPSLLPTDQSKSPFHSLLPTNTFLIEPKPLAQLSDQTPLTKFELFSPHSKPSLPLGMSENKELNDFIAKGKLNMLTLAQPEGIPLLEKIQNYRAKLKQRLSESRSADNILKPLLRSKCLFKPIEPALTQKLNPLFHRQTKARKSDCDEDDSNLDASLTDSLQKYRSKLRKSGTGDKEGIEDSLLLHENQNNPKNKPVIPAASPTTSPNESTVRAGKKKIDEVNEKEKTTHQLSQSKENTGTNKIDNNLNISSPPLDTSANGNLLHTPPRPTSDSDVDQHPEIFQNHQLKTTPKKLHFASSETTIGPILEDTESSESHKPHLSLTSKDATLTLSDHPHFLNHNDNSLSPNHFPSLLVQPTLSYIRHLSPEDRYRAMFDPIAFQNSMPQINYEALLVQNDFYDSRRDSFQNRPMGFVPNSDIPFDHPSRLMTTFNGAPDTPTNLIFSDPSGVIMRAFVPGDLPGEPHPNNPANLSPSSVYVLRPLQIQDSNIPYPDMLHHLRTGNAIVQIQPIDLEDIDKGLF